ncbi:hypothetical protein FRC08_004229 [Ceratobasidium sp. 394]|nr:hypothetical protein FRC08_004229 [Ceratobasidium sp. 394]KAG9092176.1 hypothetical protein FS749_015947 [Ceratobasidium sp. UAMH 11750]
MPAVDPEDQQATRAIETALWDAVNSHERPPIKLEWFMALPKCTRRSAELIVTAQAEAFVLLDHLRAAWTKARLAEQEWKEQLERARAQPRDLECLRAPDPVAWNGLGRRKKRCRSFEAVGRASNTRQRATSTIPPTQPAPVDVQALHQSSVDVPTRPATPPGLREAAFSCVGLLASASGVNAYGHNSPYPMPPAPPQIIHRPPSPVPPPEPQLEYEGETIIDGQVVDCRLAYLMSMGRWEGCKWRAPPTLRQSSQAILDMEALQLGMLDWLMDVFFPHRLDDWSLARTRLIYLKDFALGWYALAPGH